LIEYYVGRSPDISQFVKHGKEESESYVEVDLFIYSDVITIKRTINSDNKASKWFINNSLSSQQKVKEIMVKYSIDMDNLCSFMPQDKVGSFSQQQPDGILRMTLQTIQIPGRDITYHDLQKELSDVESHKVLRERELNMKKISKESLEKQVSNMKTEVDRIHQREELKVKLEYYEIKSLVKECQECHSAIEQKQALVDNATKILTEAKSQIQPLETNERNLKRSLAEIENTFDTINRKLQTTEEKCSKYSDVVDEIDTSLEDLGAKLETVEKQRKVDLKTEENLIRSIENYESQFNQAMIEVPKFENAVMECNSLITKINMKISQITEEIDDLKQKLSNEIDESSRYQKELTSMKDSTQIFKTKLRNQSGDRPGLFIDALTAMETVERMKNQFRLEVFGPLAMYMHVADPACAAIIEKVIPLAKLLAFMTLDSQDSRILKQEFKKLNLKVDIITMENVEITPYPALPQVGNINVQHIGTQLDCHDSIRSYLNMFCGLHRILWCRINDSVADNAINSQVIDRLLGTNDSIRLYVNRVQPSIERQKLDQSQLTEYNCVRSRYNRNILPSISTQDFLPKGLLGVASEDSSSSVRQEIEQRIRNHKQMIEAIEKEIMTKRTLLEDLHNELNKLKHQKNDANTRLVIPKDLQRKIDNEKRKLADIQIKLSINMHQQKEKLFASYDECVESSLISIEKLLELNQDKGLSNIDRCVALNYKSEVNSALHIVSEKVTEARESLKQYQQCVKTAQLERHDV
jgi:chromosome segregation ATPase